MPMKIMPHQTGKEIATSIREIAPETKIVFASAYPAAHLKETDLLEDGDILIPKPFSISEVADTVRAMLDG